MVKLLLIGALAAAANAQNPQFEVASVKANKVPNGDGAFSISAERLTAHNTFLGVLIMRAYHIDQSQFPKLSDRLLDRYDVDAKADHPVTRTEMLQMLQKLLADRFRLAFHWETKEVEGYALVTAKGGPKLRLHEDTSPTECVTQRWTTDGRVVWTGCSMGELASFSLFPNMVGLQTLAGNRFIVNKTGIDGRYDFELLASWEEQGGNPAEGPRVVNPGAPPLFIALEKQLGLKLDPQRIPVNYFIIDHLEKPSEN